MGFFLASPFVYTPFMCGRFTFTKRQPAIVAEAGGLEIGQGYAASFNIAPGQRIPCLRRDHNSSLKEVNPQWGLVPAWALNASGAVHNHKDGLPVGVARQIKPQINARVETAEIKPTFRGAWREGRCLILADGYFEWPAAKGGQQLSGREPFYVSMPDHRPFLIAGLWTPSSGSYAQRQSSASSKDGSSCAILTTVAKADIAWLHGRMPLIVDEPQALAWLDGHAPVLTKNVLLTTQVSNYVNNVAHQGPRCIEKFSGLFD
jgi:putative SOS response-associated peptidase YedK